MERCERALLTILGLTRSLSLSRREPWIEHLIVHGSLGQTILLDTIGQATTTLGSVNAIRLLIQRKGLAMRYLWLCCFFCAPLQSAELRWLELGEIGETPLQALYAEGTSAKAPVVIFNHGTGIRREGYQIGDGGNMDMAGYVTAFSDAGYTTYAPIRRFLKDEAIKRRREISGSAEQWERVVELGVEAVQRAVHHARQGDAGRKIAIVGFSEGGLVSLWSGIMHPDVDALVLMSPAAIRMAERRSLRSASMEADRLAMPVMLTLAANDHWPSMKIAASLLIPSLEKAGVPRAIKTTYRGRHATFHEVQADHIADVIAFLNQFVR